LSTTAHDIVKLRGGETVHVLLLTHDETEADWLRAELIASSQFRFEVSHASSLSEVSGVVDPKQVEVVFVMATHGDDDTLEPVHQAVSAFPDSPVLYIGQHADEALAIQALQVGAASYIAKSEIDTSRLVAALASALENHRTIRSLTLAREREHMLGTHDQLTGLANRYLFYDRLNQAVATSARNGQRIALLFLDLDDFKLVNDTLGHGVGDGLLRRVAENLSSILRESDTAGRIGGDEFAVLLTNLRDDFDAGQIANKILESMRKPIVLRNRSIQCTVSIGIATSADKGNDPKELIRRADTAMYHAKKHGRNRCEFFNEDMNAEVMRRIMLESGLHTAAENEELILCYQPLYDLRLERIVGAEALVRWRHPDLGFLAPLDFLSLAEETGLIVPLGEWILRTACEQNALWQRDGQPGFRISVNVSPRQLQEAHFAEMIETTLHETGLPPELLDLEITESSLVKGADVTLNALHRLKDLGVHLSIDDFGTGYSALSYLKHLPIDALKIDQSFVRSLNSDPADTTIIQAIVMMAQGLNLGTVAEGVETREQLLLLASYGCNRMQGYLFRKPAVAEVFERRIANPVIPWVNE
jgi:diguanylate cyclase (GGDEF)-like protein